MTDPAHPPAAAGLAVPRRILGFERDTGDAWIVHLDCGHRRHVRHRPPLSVYPWLADAAARAARVGAEIECGRCHEDGVMDRGPGGQGPRRRGNMPVSRDM